jgi:hypothetical protein
MVVGTVWSELVSDEFPCSTGKIQGNLLDLAPFSQVRLAETQAESGSLSKFPKHRNREFSNQNREIFLRIREWQATLA